MPTPLSGLTWVSKSITWAFAAAGVVPNLGTVTSPISDPGQQAAVAAGIDEWAQISGVNLVQVTDPSHADIQVGYGKPAGLLGQCIWYYNPQTSHYNNALVLLLDPSITPLTTNGAGNIIYSGIVTSLQQLATHETGAALGLGEGNGSDPNSVMNHVLGARNPVPDAADIAAIDSLYGPPVSSPKPTLPSAFSMHTLTLALSEDAWNGDAQFVVKVDGNEVGGPTSVTALHGDGATQSFTYSGTWAPGSQTLEIDFINDAYGGSPSKDRNLYVDQVTYDGVAALTSPHVLDSNGAFVLSVGR